MKKIKNIIFDLDGTISDPKEGLINSIIYSCHKFGISDYDVNEFDKFIGPPLHISYKNRFKLSDEDAIKIVKYYREYYEEKGKFENVLYPGILELLDVLFNSGITLAIATSKPIYFTNQILKYFKINQYFSSVVGSNLDNTMSDKSQIIREVIKQLKIINTCNTIMVGDRMFDIIGAHQNNIKCVSVLYGYGDEMEFKENNTDYIVKNVQDLKEFLLNII